MMVSKKSKKTFILSLGGSLIVPESGIDIRFLKRFEKFIRGKVAQGCRFFIVTGGGATARRYIEAAKKVCDSSLADEDQHWLGIHATRQNGHLLRTIFRDIAYDIVIKEYDIVDKRVAKFPVIIASGWRPGWSTDYDGVILAQDYSVDTLINLSNIGMVYDKDPKKYKDAKPIKKISWDEILKITGCKFTPGMSLPFDPIASRLAGRIGLRVIVCDGKNLRNLDNILEGRKFAGTVIE